MSDSEMDTEERQGQDVILTDVLKNLKPSSVDAERLFSYGRIAKNYLQSRMSPEIHNRNVFLNKNLKWKLFYIAFCSSLLLCYNSLKMHTRSACRHLV